MTLRSCMRAPTLALLTIATGAASGCDLQRIAADQTAEVAEAGSLGFNGFWDYEIFGQAVPSAILQTEALVRVSPENQKLLLGLTRMYVVYAYGWLGDEWELADERGDFERADVLEGRIMRVYERATRVALKVVHLRDKKKQLKDILKTGKIDPLKAYLRDNFKQQADVSSLYWVGIAWGAMIGNSGGDMNMLADAPLARAFIERSAELDPTFADAGAFSALGTVEASFPELFGGSLEKAKSYYERALEISKRRNHLVLLSYAKSYAVAKQDRALFTQLLHEILAAPDQGDELRMNNKVARHRAERYLKRVDDWFAPGGDAPTE